MTRRSHATYSTKQPQGTNGRPACLECSGDITDARRSTFCGKVCSDSFYIKSRPEFARRKVWERDHGICALCGVDTMAGTTIPVWRTARGSGHRWQADHVIPVVEGGGTCGLDNYRTLCTACHRSETKALAGRRAIARKEMIPC